ncbi:Hydrogenase transcriptional regulatory protein hupR1 [Planctomycetes bacterium CA13]|uniref:Hydrogenase transcriptional regulatory protein hupR1 n=1 Tax=Novipirellula herctigrandis TaxID=2527986 RepID=A0A5C5ZA61_9BACT|nr:Hydrogenase transcriptional regulatory protein hupR1 [Planctomycetes bacterium CA13]
MNFHAGKQVLYVDDEPHALKYFSQLFGDEFEIVTAESAEQGMAYIEANPSLVAVLVTDQIMPEKTGVELMEQVRTQYPKIVRVLTTAHSNLESAIKAVNEGGAFRYLTKPWNDTEMVGTLLRAIEYHQAMDDRDRLLNEKLSVLHRLIVMDRVRGLALAATALEGQLRGSWEALTEYMRQSPVKKRIEIQMEEIANMNMVAIARHSTREMVETIEVLLKDTIRCSTGEDTNVDVTAILESYVDRSRAAFANDDLQIVVHVTDTLEKIDTDSGMLRRLLEIIVRRLADVQDKPGRIEISISQSGEETLIDAKSNFEELDDDQIASFFSAAIPLNKWPIGLDMDLLSAFMITRHLGGRMTIAPSPPSGPSLSVTLPIHPPKTVESEVTAEQLDTVYESLKEWERELLP